MRDSRIYRDAGCAGFSEFAVSSVVALLALLVEQTIFEPNNLAMTNTKPDSWYEQSGVVPYRLRSGQRSGQLEVLLITSVKKGNWIVPKGIVEEGFSPAESAMKEALEEAGVVGHIVGEALGSYEQNKWGGTCRVELFAMHVDKELENWPEANVRKRQWVTIDGALEAVANRKLASVIAKIVDVVNLD